MTEPRIYELLMLLRERGGALVRVDDCPAEEQALAIREHRATVDSDTHGWLWRPPVRRPSAPDT